MHGVSRRIKRKIYSNEETLPPLGSPARRERERENGLKISAPPKMPGVDFHHRQQPTAPASSRRRRRIERAVSLSRSRPVWTPGRVSPHRRKRDARVYVAVAGGIAARPSIIAVSARVGLASVFRASRGGQRRRPRNGVISRKSERERDISVDEIQLRSCIPCPRVNFQAYLLPLD